MVDGFEQRPFSGRIENRGMAVPFAKRDLIGNGVAFDDALDERFKRGGLGCR